MRHTHTPAENFMLANTWLDVVEGLMTLDEANAHLAAQYEHHPSQSSVSSYLAAARSCYESLEADSRPKSRAARPKPRRSAARNGNGNRRFSRELLFEMHLAVDQRAGD